jgi:hypothetical protein
MTLMATLEIIKRGVNLFPFSMTVSSIGNTITKTATSIKYSEAILATLRRRKTLRRKAHKLDNALPT